jgi:hypothetical protein
VYGFRASSTGQLSTIPGSPFKPAGRIVGATPTKFFTLGEDLIHSYGIASDGAIESQLSQIPFFDYSGNECGPSNSVQQGAVLDHTGRYIYVLLWCGGEYIAPYEYRYQSAEYQTYLIHSDGAFSNDGDAVVQASSGGYTGYLPSILGNERFAYAAEPVAQNTALVGFRRTPAGTLELMEFTESDPTPSKEGYFADSPDASPTGNYLVLQLYPGETTNPAQFGTYTVASNGNISTTNTWSNMPVTSLYQPHSTFSPSGNLFVAYGGNEAIGANGNGIEIYKFNGAAPLTLYQTLLRGTRINDVKWDGSNHMYAISTANNMLYVFTVTSTSVTEDSSWSIGSPSKMVVVSK